MLKYKSVTEQLREEQKENKKLLFTIEQLRSDLDYLSMMTEINLDDETKTSCIGFVNTACYILVYLFLNNYFAKCSTILFAASFVSSGSPKAESLRKPSPHEPKPTPGVPTI